MQGEKAAGDESGMADLPMMHKFFNAFLSTKVSGVLVWSERIHRRDGGFYYHNESDTVYNSYHWPGFAAGDGYDEKAVLNLVRDAAYSVRDDVLNVPAPEFPPVLFPISPLRELNWRGSTGASGYDIERATSPDGPWTLVGENVPDVIVDAADVIGFEKQCEVVPLVIAPCWRDTAVKGGGPYFYRVAARNSAGRSAWSNTMQFR